jgi:hypothetical protein
MNLLARRSVLGIAAVVDVAMHSPKAPVEGETGTENCKTTLAHRPGRGFGRTEAAHRAVTRRFRMELVHRRDVAEPSCVVPE